MKYFNTFFVVLTLLVSCNSNRVKQLETENLQLRSELDSLKSAMDAFANQSKQVYLEARKKGAERMDSLINLNETKVLIAYISCDELEANIEIERSVDMIEERLKTHEIEIYKLQGFYPEDSDCGYELAHGARRQKVNGAMTDYDLALLVEKFYNIKILN